MVRVDRSAETECRVTEQPRARAAHRLDPTDQRLAQFLTERHLCTLTTLRQDGLAKAWAGHTSLAEVLRVAV